MHPDKKKTKEDTWNSDDLRKHIRGEAYEKEPMRRPKEYDRKHRGGDSVESPNTDPEKESRRERDKYQERESTQGSVKPREKEKERHLDGRKDASRNRASDREERHKEKTRERGRVGESSKYRDAEREPKERSRDREGKENRDKEKARDRDKDKDRTRERERGEERERGKGREDKNGAEKINKEQRAEKDRKRVKERGEEGRDRERRHDSERKDRHRERNYGNESESQKDKSHDKDTDKERRERDKDRAHVRQHEDREEREKQRKVKDKEIRYKEKGQHDAVQSWSHDKISMKQSDSRGSKGHNDGELESEERNKHREQRQRHTLKTDGDYSERTSTKKPASDRDASDNAEFFKAEVKNEEALSDDENGGSKHDYEEDFEDYEEDFDDDDDDDDHHESEEEGEDVKEKQRCEEGEDITPKINREIEAIQKAINEENKRVGTAQSRPDTDEDKRPKTTKDSDIFQSPGPQHGKFIDFVAAKHREVSRKVGNKQKKRSTELLRLIDLDFSMTFSLLDLPPVNEYDMYIKSFGTTNTKQAYVQCNEDNVDRDIQTEEKETSEVWTQHPAERNGACGGLAQEIPDDFKSQIVVDSQRLAKFLHCASQVVTVLMEEDHTEKQSLKKLRSQIDTMSFSEGCLQLNTKLPFLHGRQISLVHFSEVQKQAMLSVHSPSSKPSAVRLDSKTVICIWNIWEPSRPQKILVYESEVCCCCFSPGKATLVFAGTAVGSVVLWDLREHASSHYSLTIGDSDWTLRHPTFSTDSVLAFSGHMSSVCSVEAVRTTAAGRLRAELPLLASEEESSGLSFQLASLDENGVLNLWVVLELPTANDSGSQTELGLRPGGKVKLLHSSSILTIERNLPRDAMKTGLPQALLLRFLPTDTSHFFIGTNMSLVSHGTIHGLKAHPKFYRPQVVGARPVDVTSIQFSAFVEHLFLVGCGDGSIRLHTVSSEQPVMEWSGSSAGEPVVSVQWTQTHPTLFLVLDAASSLYLWDLLENEFEPVATEKNNIDRITTMAVFGDRGQKNTYSGIALARMSGKIEVQYFTKRFTEPNSESLGKLESMMNEAF